MAQEQALLFSEMSPTRRQVQLLAFMAVALLAAFGATLPFRSVRLPEVTAFIPIVDTVLLFGDLITASLLFAQFWVQRTFSLLVLGCGYTFAGLIIIPHALTFPGAFADNGLLGAGVNTTAWLYVFWHFGLPLAVIAYAVLSRQNPPAVVSGSKSRAVSVAVAGCAFLVVALTLLTTAGHDLLPGIMSDTVNWSSRYLYYSAILVMVLLSVAIVLLLRGPRSILDLWLAITLWAWLIEVVLITLTSSRYSLFWYAGRLYGLLSGLLVLLMLLSETTKLYARLILSALSRRQESESRIMTMNSATAAIAHEVNQPLAAIVNNGSAALRFLALPSPNLDETRAAVTRIVQDGHRAASIIQSIRALFRNITSEVTPVDVNLAIQDALALIAGELSQHKISIKLELDVSLPRVPCNRVHLQQVFLNLAVNAVEAMSAPNIPARTLSFKSLVSAGDRVTVLVEDSGPGIDPHAASRIFDPFFTTKPRGMGMGLALCRSIVESAGGRLVSKAGQRGGAVFEVVLPVARDVSVNQGPRR